MRLQAKNMRKSIHRVSLLLALKKARIVTVCVLLLDFVQRVYYKYPITGLYMLLLYAVLPLMLERMLCSYIGGELEQELPIMQKTYKYTKHKYVSLGITTVVVNVIGILWAMKTSKTRNISAPYWHIKMGPFLIWGICISVILLAYCHNRRELMKRLKNNSI